jgi:nucleotide-binding universal stress UspA family protein
VEGEPHHVLAQMSAEVDLLVIGHHHHGALRRLVMSDVAESLADHSRCPLLVLPGGT